MFNPFSNIIIRNLNYVNFDQNLNTDDDVEFASILSEEVNFEELMGVNASLTNGISATSITAFTSLDVGGDFEMDGGIGSQLLVHSNKTSDLLYDAAVRIYNDGSRNIITSKSQGASTNYDLAVGGSNSKHLMLFGSRIYITPTPSSTGHGYFLANNTRNSNFGAHPNNFTGTRFQFHGSSVGMSIGDTLYFFPSASTFWPSALGVANHIHMWGDGDVVDLLSYNDFVSTTEYERGFIRWVADEWVIGTETLAGTKRNIVIDGGNRSAHIDDVATGTDTDYETAINSIIATLESHGLSDHSGRPASRLPSCG